MTPRTKDSGSAPDLERVYSDLLTLQLKSQPSTHNLRSDGALFDVFHPKVLRAILSFMEAPNLGSTLKTSHGWHLTCFAHREEALALKHEAPLVSGYPWQVGQVLNSQYESVFIDFPPLGTVLLSKGPSDLGTTEGLHQHVIPVWVDYALSPELWGEQGKWPRFHRRLRDLFQKSQLLQGKDCPGHYPLDIKAQKLSLFGYEGTSTENGYSLTLPWSFSLSALEGLEAIIQQEF